MTEWRVIPGFHEYEVSDRGEVRNRATGVVRKQQTHRKGHRLIHAYPGDRVLYVHRAMAAAFLGPVEGKVVRHLDGNPANNTLSNLAIGTQSENMYDAVRHGTHINAAKTSCSSGHTYSPENTRMRAGVWRECTACERERHETLVSAARSLGMTYTQYRAVHGQSLVTAQRILDPKEK